jgi:hypothetical protein
MSICCGLETLINANLAHYSMYSSMQYYSLDRHAFNAAARSLAGLNTCLLTVLTGAKWLSKLAKANTGRRRLCGDGSDGGARNSIKL